MIVIPRASLRTILSDLRKPVPGAAEAGLFVDCTIDLYMNDTVPGGATVAADFEVADFSGYAQKEVSLWGAAFENNNGDAQILAPMQTWTHNGGVTANTVYGYFVLSAAGGLLWAERFDEPKQMNGAEDQINVVPAFTLASTEPEV